MRTGKREEDFGDVNNTLISSVDVVIIFSLQIDHFFVHWCYQYLYLNILIKKVKSNSNVFQWETMKFQILLILQYVLKI